MNTINKQSNPLLGNFSGVENNEPRGSSFSKKEVPDTTVIAPVQQEIKPKEPLQSKEVAEALQDKEPLKAPEEIYKNTLKALDISEEDARKILDGIFCNNYYEESGCISNRVNYTLRTRQCADLDRVLLHIEHMAPKMAMHTQDIIAKYNLAASIVKYGEETFEFPNRTLKEVTSEDIENAFHHRLDFVKNLAAPVLEILIKKVAEFDIKISAVTSDGAPEDF